MSDSTRGLSLSQDGAESVVGGAEGAATSVGINRGSMVSSGWHNRAGAMVDKPGRILFAGREGEILPEAPRTVLRHRWQPFSSSGPPLRDPPVRLSSRRAVWAVYD